MASTTTRFATFLAPADLTMMKRVLERVCAERSIHVPSVEADSLAANLIHAFQHGAREEKGLVELLDRTRPN